jgi:hypothetical protein
MDYQEILATLKVPGLGLSAPEYAEWGAMYLSQGALLKAEACYSAAALCTTASHRSDEWSQLAQDIRDRRMEVTHE